MVENIIISKQPEDSENFQKFLEIVQKKRIDVKVIEAGMKVNIEKDLYLDVLWPCSSNFISDNALNNNSIVCKLVYNNFSVLFTGDVEGIAELEIISKYKNKLSSTVLKVAHHGSKSSSKEKFLQEVKPKIALIGVGGKNIFGHPNSDVLRRLKAMNCSIYRTDRNGEIIMRVNKEGKNRIYVKNEV